MDGKLLRACAIAVLLCATGAAQATFHLWKIDEIYSNADGTVQYVELSTTFAGQQFVGGHVISAFQGITVHTFTLPSDLPGDTTNKKFLIATPGFAALNVVAPDFIMPNGFLFIPGGGFDFAGVDAVSYAALPSDGSLSIDRTGASAVNSPTNFAGATGTIVVTPPGAPTIGSAAAGNGQATISFTPPVGALVSPISSYTVTCNPGAVSAAGAASPITVAGLANGTLYSCTATASNSAGQGPASAAVTVTPLSIVTSGSGASATGTGTISASFTGGGATCSFTIAQFIAVQGSPSSPPAGSAPAGIVFPQGLFDFRAAGCAAGSTLAMTIVYPTALPAGTQYWKYGPTAAQPAAHWYTLPATITGNTVTFTITDGGLGDDDLLANGSLVDQGGPGVPGAPAAPAAPIPTLDEWALAALAAILAASGLTHRSRFTRR